MNATFYLYSDNKGEWRWRLLHQNGNIIADGGEGYTTKQAAQEGIASVKTNAPTAPIVDNAAPANTTAFVVFTDEAGKVRWNLRHANTKILADGGQGYSSADAARQGIASVQANAPAAPIVEKAP